MAWDTILFFSIKYRNYKKQFKKDKSHMDVCWWRKRAWSSMQKNFAGEIT